MACAGRNFNQFSVLDHLNPPLPNEQCQGPPQRTLTKGHSRHSGLVPTKAHRNVDPCHPQQPYGPARRQNGRPGAPGQRQDYQPEKRTLPPRFQMKLLDPEITKGFCNPMPICPEPVDPCPTISPLSSEAANAILRKKLEELQMKPAATIPPPCQPINTCMPTVKHISTVLIPQSNQHTAPGDNILSSTPTQQTIACQNPPQNPHVLSCPPASPIKPIAPSDNLKTSMQSPPARQARQTQRSPEIVSRTPANASDLTVPPPIPKINLPRPADLSGQVQRPVPTPEAVSCSSRNVSNPIRPLVRYIVKLPPPGSARHIQRPHAPGVLLPTPTNTSDLMCPSEELKMRVPPPPGLPPRRGGRFGHGARGMTRPQFNQELESSIFERHNALMDASREVFLPPSSATSNLVKLPTRKDVPQVLSSPATTVTSLSEDLSGGSSVVFSSDTSFTTVDSNTSNKISEPPKLPYVCRNWMKGYPCHITPCRLIHPPRPNQPTNEARQPAQSHSVPPPPGIVRQFVGPRDQGINLAPRTHDPQSLNAEPPPRPEPFYATTIADHIKVQFDKGFEVREVVTGFESRWVHIGNLVSTVTSDSLQKLLAPYKVDNINLHEPSGKSTTAKVQFASAEDAMKAMTDLNGSEFARRTISAKLAINNSIGGGTVLTDTDVQLVWECPFRVGYVGYETLKEAKVAIDTLNGFLMDYLVVSAQLYEGLPCVGAYNVIFKQLPASVTEQSLREFAKSDAVMLGRPNYLSLERAISTIRSRLEEYGAVASFDVVPPPYGNGMVKAWARFTNPAEARAAQEDMDRRRPKVIGHATLSCRHVVSVSHVLGAGSYRRLREDIGWLRWSWQRRYGPAVGIRERFKENDEGAPAYIRLSSEHPELLSSLKYEFEQLLHGETVTLNKKPVWDNFLIAEAGRAYISQLQAQYPGVEIQVQTKRRVVSLWGPIVMRHRARQDIVRKIVELNALQFWKIPLSGKLLGTFCSTELSTMQELLGAENCILDFGERVLVVRGNDLAFRTACDAVQAAQSRQSDETRSSDTVCPVCFGEAVVPVSLACGHQWCRACLTGYLDSAVENKMFPLRCLGNDATCAQCIPLGLSRKLLSAADFNAVIEAAFWVYVHSRPDEFHHCPTPDCTQVYRSAPPNSVLQCPSCLVRICPACRIEYHDGMTCEERDVAEDKLFNEWTANHDVKSCPGCKAPIERSEGCNHMTCTRCQTHICWECMATFPRGQGIYDHMRHQHGGIGL